MTILPRDFTVKTIAYLNTLGIKSYTISALVDDQTATHIFVGTPQLVFKREGIPYVPTLMQQTADLTIRFAASPLNASNLDFSRVYAIPRQLYPSIKNPGFAWDVPADDYFLILGDTLQSTFDSLLSRLVISAGFTIEH